MDRDEIALSGPANAEFARVARVCVSAVADVLSADVEQIDDLRLAVSELVNCAIDTEADALSVRFGRNAGQIKLIAAFVTNKNQIDAISHKILDSVLIDFQCAQQDGTMTISGQYLVVR